MPPVLGRYLQKLVAALLEEREGQETYNDRAASDLTTCFAEGLESDPSATLEQYMLELTICSRSS